MCAKSVVRVLLVIAVASAVSTQATRLVGGEPLGELHCINAFKRIATSASLPWHHVRGRGVHVLRRFPAAISPPQRRPPSLGLKTHVSSPENLISEKAASSQVAGVVGSRGRETSILLSDHEDSESLPVKESRSEGVSSLAHEETNSCVQALLSRQLLLYGQEQTRQLPAASVLIVGCSGAGVEAAKCLLQAGVGSVFLADPKVPSLEDCSENFAVAEYFEKKENLSGAVKVASSAPPSRASVAAVSLRRLAAPYAEVCEVQLHKSPLETEDQWRQRVEKTLGQVCVVVLADRPLSQVSFFEREARSFMQRRRRKKRKRLCSVALWNAGLSGLLAVDFGQAFSFSDLDEDSALSALLARHGGANSSDLHAAFPVSVLNFECLTSALQPKPPSNSDATRKTRSRRRQRGAVSEKPFQDSDLLRTAFFALLEFGERDKGCSAAPEVSALGELRLPRTQRDREWIARRCASLASTQGGSSEGEDSLAKASLDAYKAGRLLSSGAQGKTAPMAAALGALAAQEALKAITRRFKPIHQALLLSALDIVELISKSQKGETQKDTEEASEEERNQDRWISQRRIFGDAFQKRLAKLNVLVVGVGAVGCEFVKNVLLMGLSMKAKVSMASRADQCFPSICKLLAALRRALCRRSCGMYVQQKLQSHESSPQGGELTLLDGDVVERSNLNRQFLFDASAIGLPKVRAAAAAASRLCSRVDVRGFQLQVGTLAPPFENALLRSLLERRIPAERPFAFVFLFQLSASTIEELPPRLLEKQDVLLAALDSVSARLFVDRLCWLLRKPWVEAGTFGLRGHAQSVVPFVTETYAAAAPPVEDEGEGVFDKRVPLCAVRGVPLSPLHAAHWASEFISSVLFRDLAVAAALLTRLVERPSSPLLHLETARLSYDAATRDTSCSSQDPSLRRIRELVAEENITDPAQLKRVLLILRVFLTALDLESPQTVLESALFRQSVDVSLQLFTDIFYTNVKKLKRLVDERSASGGAGSEEVAVAAKAQPLIRTNTDRDFLKFVEATTRLLLLAASSSLCSFKSDGFSSASTPPYSEASFTRSSLETFVLQLGSAHSTETKLRAGQQVVDGISEESEETEEKTSEIHRLAVEVLNAAGALREGANRESALLRVRRLNAFVKTLDAVNTDSALNLQLLTAAARLRCRCFNVQPLPTASEVEQLLGRIVPATSTATTLAAALACFELYRLAALECIGKNEQLSASATCKVKRSSAKLLSRLIESRPPFSVSEGREETVFDLVLDGGSFSSNSTKCLRAKTNCLRNSFFSLSVPFIVQTLPLPVPLENFRGGLWSGRSFSPWHCMRLTLQAAPVQVSKEAEGVCSSTACQSPPSRVHPDKDSWTEEECSAASRCSVATLVRLIEERTGCSVSALLCGDAVLFTREALASAASGAAPLGESDLSFPPTGPSATHLSVAAVLRSIFEEQRKKDALLPEGQRVQWAVIDVVATHANGEEAHLPPLKVPVSLFS